MEITNVRIRLVENANPRMKAYVSLTFDDELVVYDIRICEGKNGLMLAFPNKEIAPGKKNDIIHPINKETRERFTKVVLDEYEKELKKKNESH